MSFTPGDAVWKQGSENGYAGPGIVVSDFKNWMGQPRYVVAHRITGGNGWFYHIYSGSQLTLDKLPMGPGTSESYPEMSQAPKKKGPKTAGLPSGMATSDADTDAD